MAGDSCTAKMSDNTNAIERKNTCKAMQGNGAMAYI